MIRKPWPGMLRGVHNDRQRFIETYWSTVMIGGKPVYTAGDGARRDEDGYFWIMGRIDDVINVSGHRLGTMEVRAAGEPSGGGGGGGGWCATRDQGDGYRGVLHAGAAPQAGRPAGRAAREG